MDAHDGSEPVKQLPDIESVWMLGLVKRCWLRGPEIELPPTKNVNKGNSEYAAGMFPDNVADFEVQEARAAGELGGEGASEKVIVQIQ